MRRVLIPLEEIIAKYYTLNLERKGWIRKNTSGESAFRGNTARRTRENDVEKYFSYPAAVRG